jgi:hypothetical protein
MVSALVDLQLVLEKIGHEQTRIGEWVNIIGYVSQQPPKISTSSQHIEVHIQALLLWSAGPLDIQQYEASVEARESSAPDVDSNLVSR